MCLDSEMCLGEVGPEPFRVPLKLHVTYGLQDRSIYTSVKVAPIVLVAVTRSDV